MSNTLSGAAKTKDTDSRVPEAMNAGRLSPRKLAATAPIDSGESYRAVRGTADPVQAFRFPIWDVG
jgi:hypothetical protein